MAIKVPLTFQIFENGELAREEKLVQGLQDPIKIGKAPTSRIRLSDEEVSRNHAVIDIVMGAEGVEVLIIDVGSASGTFVNGQRINKTALKNGDSITLGNTRIDVAVGDVVEEAAPVAAVPTASPFGAAVANPFGSAVAASEPVETDPELTQYGIVASGPPVSADEVETTQQSVEVVIMWGDNQVLHVEHLSPPRNFVVGDAVDAKGKPLTDFLIGSELLGTDSLPIVLADGGVRVVIPEGATGELIVNGASRPLSEAPSSPYRGGGTGLAHASEVALSAGTTARFGYRGMTFVVRPVAAGKVIGGTTSFDWKSQAWTLASFAIFGCFLLFMAFMPPASSSLSLDLLDADSRLARYLIQPPETLQEETPEWLQNEKKNDDEGGKGKAHKGDEGQMGKQDSKKTKNKFAIEGPADNSDPHMAREQAREQAKNAGILGVLRSSMGSWNSPTSEFGRDTALGNDPMSALGALMGDQIGENFGFGGLGLRGTGRGGGGTGEGTIGLGNIGTIGHGGGGGDGSGYGRGAGGLGGRGTKAPRVRMANADVRGSLSKEVIRRVIQRHLNEVRFCYEQQLNARPDLHGRVVVNFIISPTGAVQGSAVQESDMGSPPVENCIATAVRRWSFPAPEGGGIVIVNYPFVLEAASE